MLSTEEIAASMYLSVNTVKTHFKSIFRKLGATRRGEAVRRAKKTGTDLTGTDAAAAANVPGSSRATAGHGPDPLCHRDFGPSAAGHLAALLRQG